MTASFLVKLVYNQSQEFTICGQSHVQHEQNDILYITSIVYIKKFYANILSITENQDSYTFCILVWYGMNKILTWCSAECVGCNIGPHSISFDCPKLCVIAIVHMMCGQRHNRFIPWMSWILIEVTFQVQNLTIFICSSLGKSHTTNIFLWHFNGHETLKIVISIIYSNLTLTYSTCWINRKTSRFYRVLNEFSINIWMFIIMKRVL